MYWMEEYSAANDYELLRQPGLPMEALKLYSAILVVEIGNLRSIIEELEDLEDGMETDMLLIDRYGVEERANSLDVGLDGREVYVG